MYLGWSEEEQKFYNKQWRIRFSVSSARMNVSWRIINGADAGQG